MGGGCWLRLAGMAAIGAVAQGTAVAGGVPCATVTAPPGALYLYQDEPLAFRVTGNNFAIDGNDRNFDGTAGPMDPVAGIATRNEANAIQVVGSLGGSQLDNVQGLGHQLGPPEVPSVLPVPGGPSDSAIDAFIDGLIALFGTVTYSGTTISGNIVIGTVSSPGVSHFVGSNLEVRPSGTVSGAGVMVVDGDLTITGTFDYAGLVIVRGITRIEAGDGATPVGGTAWIYGSLWTRGFEHWSSSALLLYSGQALALAAAAGGNAACTPAVCGNGVLEPGEACDDGNLAGGDCCAPDCTPEAAGSPCTDDGDVCTDDVCTAAGACLHSPNMAPCDDGDACTTGDTCAGGACIGGTPVTCAPCLSCDPHAGCGPPTCRLPDRPGRARLVRTETKRGARLRFAWRGGAIALPELGDPARTDGYEVCVASDESPAPLLLGSAGPGFACAGGAACWRGRRRGWLWRRGTTSATLRRIRLRTGTVRSAGILVTAGGGGASLPSGPLTVQVRGTHGPCWAATFPGTTTAPGAVRRGPSSGGRSGGIRAPR